MNRVALTESAMRENDAQPPGPEAALTAAARAALGLARAEAAVMGHHYLGTEHILLGVFCEGKSAAAQMLASQTTLDAVRARVVEVVGVGSGVPTAEFPLTRGASDVLHFARREADMHRETRIGPEHLLLGILREGDGIAAQVLLSLSVDLGTLVAGVSRSLPHDGDVPGGGAANAVEVDVSANRIKVVDLESCDLLLRVSNQSYLDDPVVLTVMIDGVELVSRPFHVRNQHHFVPFPLRMGPGTHRVWVSTDTGVVLEEEFVLPPSGVRQHASIEYYNYADEDGKLIDWFIRSTPMGTM